MGRLTLFSAIIAGPVITGTLMIIAFSFGDYSGRFIDVSTIVGWLLAVPVGIGVSSLILRRERAMQN